LWRLYLRGRIRHLPGDLLVAVQLGAAKTTGRQVFGDELGLVCLQASQGIRRD